MYTDNFEEEILFIPARKDGEACNHLKIVTAFTDVERISSHLIKLFDGRNKEYVSGIKVDIILGMTKGTGLTQKKHDKICSLIKRLNSVSGMPQISCNYIVEGKQVHSKVYVWCRGRKAIEAFNGSANYTMNAFFVRRECMDACNPKEANHYFNSLLPDTINCFDGQIKDKVSFSSKKNVEDDVADTNLENLSWENYRAIEPVDTLEVSLLKADSSDTGYGSGVNWGIRKNGYKRNRNQAYIPYNVADHKDGFFPDVNADGTYPVFKVVTKELYAVHGKIEQNSMKQLKRDGTKIIVTIDRNIISLLNTAVKKGTFDGANKKKITGFLMWTIRNDFEVNPYDSVREGVYRNGNISCNKEIELFNYFYDNVAPDVVIKSFYNDGIMFEGKTFEETSSEELLDFNRDNAGFNFIYAAILHFVYVIRTETTQEKRFYNFFEWYMEECIISEYVLAYVLLYLENKGAPPHNYLNDEETINGCINEAFDLLYIQEIDPRRYPSDKYTLFFATQDNLLSKIFEMVNDREKYSNIEEYLEVLFSGFSSKKRVEYINSFSIMLEKHTCKINEENAFSVSNMLVEIEERRLKSLLNL